MIHRANIRIAKQLWGGCIFYTVGVLIILIQTINISKYLHIQGVFRIVLIDYEKLSGVIEWTQEKSSMFIRLYLNLLTVVSSIDLTPVASLTLWHSHDRSFSSAVSVFTNESDILCQIFATERVGYEHNFALLKS